MSAELLPVREPDGTTEAVQGISVGGSKPLHRFLKGQPKIIGIAVLIMGVSFVTVSIAITSDHYGDHIWITIPPGIFLGTLFIICGILYILTEHNPTKKTVTISLALSIVTILAACWTLLHIMGDFHIASGVYDYEFHYNETETDRLWRTHYNVMGVTLEAVHAVYSFVAVIIFIIMSVLAGAALRSTKTQAIVVMNVTAPETPVE
ncbi:uncharacterized protein LOC108237326 [Kryptolebias marmoratus]|uniref:Uncharacterized LOC108237326 n=1 Tax=Kryptolebias marmoratus TaxID=37003 RepID=A0A3Q3B740_KRYMA|nr:uncharacterized protein LOC108237326 [Kryptolebias marmoratus]